MSSLQKLDFASFDSLLPAERKILNLAQSSPRISQLNYDQRVDLGSKILLIVATRLGQGKTVGAGTQLEYLEKDLCKFPELTGDEIIQALDMGIDGKFTPKGEPIIFNLSRFVLWVQEWVETYKAPTMTKISRLMQEDIDDVVPELNLRDSFNSKFIILHDAIAALMAGNRFFDGGNSIYMLLTMIGEESIEPATEAIDQRAAVIARLRSLVNEGEDACLSFINSVREKIQIYLERHG